VRFEPELFAIATVALGSSVRRGHSPFGATAWRPVLALSALVGFLIAADVTGGSDTHHPERSLLPVFWFLALLAAGLVVRLAEQPRAWRLPLLAVPLAFAGTLLLRPALRSSFVERGEEEQVGRVLRRLGATDVALDTDDFGFFAVQAGLGYGASWVLDERDPRKRRAPAPRSTPELEQRLRAGHSRWLVTPRERAELALPLGKLVLSTPRFVVVQLNEAR